MYLLAKSNEFVRIAVMNSRRNTHVGSKIAIERKCPIVPYVSRKTRVFGDVSVVDRSSARSNCIEHYDTLGF
jgi:hypothetical protein